MNRTIIQGALGLAFLAAAGLTGCQAGTPTPSPAPSPSAATVQTDEQKIVYAVGVMLGSNVANLNFTPEELELLKKGLTDSATGKKPEVDMAQFGPKIQAFAEARAKARAVAERGKAQGFLDAAAKEPGALKTPSGLVYTTLTEGKGKSPNATDKVKVHYRGTLTDGTEFDSSYKRGEPIEFPLNGVIPCWTEGVQRMKVGEKAKLVCPSEIAYGERGQPPVIPGGATLVFEVELLDIPKK
jgi:FKBP-type peptidyl-prolyl cis-trans isomerase FkpA